MMMFFIIFSFVILPHFGDAQLHALTSTLRYLYQQSDVRLDSPVNVFVDSKTRELQYLEAIQNDLGLSVLHSQSQRDYFTKMKSYRVKWKGWVNVLELKTPKEIDNYFTMIRKRWYTHDELYIGEKRKMDFIFNNIIHVIVLKTEDWNERNRRSLQSVITEEMLVLLISYSPDEKDFTVYFNRGSSNGLNQMTLINMWTEKSGFVRRGRLYSSQTEIYENLNGRTFQHPVIHKPPWNYVTYGPNKEFIEDNGGRDITLLDILSKTLNFKHESTDPEVAGVLRTRGSKFNSNQSFPGIIGALHSRQDGFYFYLGDTTQTYNRNKAVEFSFYVLADAGAFATTAGRSFVPPDLLIKPFSKEIWALVLLSFALGCFAIIYFYNFLKKGSTKESLTEQSIKMGLVMIKLFICQSDKNVTDYSPKSKDSFRIILGTYVIMMSATLSASYSGMLVSFFSLPSYEKTLNTLEELNGAMSLSGSTSKMALGVVEGSSSFGIISTGGGVYGKIWTKMQTQKLFKLQSVSQGLDEVMSNPKFSVFAGRQKLLFDTLRLGGKSLFHVNQSPFFVKYKCVAFRSGSPLKDVFNGIILKLHAAGIIDKITSHEFNGLTRRIGRNGRDWEKKYKLKKVQGGSLENTLPKIALKHIAAIFYVLLILHFLAALIFATFERKCSWNINLF